MASKSMGVKKRAPRNKKEKVYCDGGTGAIFKVSESRVPQIVKGNNGEYILQTGSTIINQIPTTTTPVYNVGGEINGGYPYANGTQQIGFSADFSQDVVSTVNAGSALRAAAACIVLIACIALIIIIAAVVSAVSSS